MRFASQQLYAQEWNCWVKGAGEYVASTDTAKKKKISGSDCINVHSEEQCMRVSVTPPPCPHLVLLICFI